MSEFALLAQGRRYWEKNVTNTCITSNVH